MQLKKFTALFLMLILVVGGTVGCGSKTETPAAETATETTTTETATTETTTTEEAAPASDSEWEYKEADLTMLIDGDTSAAGLEAVLAIAKEKLGINVELELRAGGADGDNIVKTRLASGDMSDMALYNSGSLLAALNPSEYFIDISGEEFAAKIDDTFKGAVTVDGGVYGVPFSSAQAGAILYSKPMYEELGLKVPTTWDEFIANCDAIKAAGKTPIFGAFADSWTAQVMYLGDHYNVAAAEPNFAKEFEAGTAKYATSAAGLKSWAKLAQTSTYYNEDYLAATYDDGCDAIANAEAGHWVMLTMALSNIFELYGDQVNDIGVFGIPGDDANDQGLTVWMPGAIYGNKNTDKTEDILRFMEFYISDEAIDAYAGASSSSPFRC